MGTNVSVIDERGWECAMMGLALSYNQDPRKMERVAERLCTSDNGENKFLEAMIVWMSIKMPRYWWQQFDTYRVGVSKQSGSTMHTLMKRRLTQKDFVQDIPDSILDYLNVLIECEQFDKLKVCLPEGFLQERIVTTNYKTLRHIYHQRRHHKLKEWQEFCDELEYQLEYPAYVVKPSKEKKDD